MHKAEDVNLSRSLTYNVPSDYEDAKRFLKSAENTVVDIEKLSKHDKENIQNDKSEVILEVEENQSSVQRTIECNFDNDKQDNNGRYTYKIYINQKIHIHT